MGLGKKLTAPPPQGIQALLTEKARYLAARRNEEVKRRGKLQAFLSAHKEASEWSVCLAALVDAKAHGVNPSDRMVEDAIKRCGLKGKLEHAKWLYTQFYKELGRPRQLSTHISFMEACSACGNFSEAKKQLDRLISYDVQQHAKRSGQHSSAVTDDLVTSYLKAALSSHVRGITVYEPPVSKATKSSFDGPAPAVTLSQPVWEVALADLVRIRNPKVYPPSLFRKRVELTPLLVEVAAQLADVGNHWEWALRLLRSAAREGGLIPPEAMDAAARVCFRHRQYGEVVTLLEKMLATRSSPAEKTVRLGITAAEEVAVAHCRRTLICAPHLHQSAARSSSLGGIPLDSPLQTEGRVPLVADPALSSSSSSTCVAWAMGLQLFDSLRLNGLPLYQQSYESPLRACAAAGQWEEAMRMLEVMKNDGRPVSTSLFRVVVASRIEYGCETFESVAHLLRLPSLQSEDSGMNTLFLAALRWCLRRQDWRHFDSLHREMVRREIPESYDKTRLLIESAYHRKQYHLVLTRFARFYNITSYERKRVEKDGSVRMYEEDFYVSEGLLDLVLDAYAQLTEPSVTVKHHNRGKEVDPMWEVAYRAALETRQRLHQDGSASLGGKQSSPSWMFSRRERKSDQ